MRGIISVIMVSSETDKDACKLTWRQKTPWWEMTWGRTEPKHSIWIIPEYIQLILLTHTLFNCNIVESSWFVKRIRINFLYMDSDHFDKEIRLLVSCYFRLYQLFFPSSLIMLMINCSFYKLKSTIFSSIQTLYSKSFKH